MSAKLEGDRNNARAVSKLKNTERLIKKGLRAAMFKCGKTLIATTSKEILRKPKSGRTYNVYRSGRKRRHVASAPYETHANLTGAARKSLSYQLRGQSEILFGYGVSGKNAPDYVKYLEQITPEGKTRRMKPRPSIQNGVNASEKDMYQHFDDEVEKLLS